MKRVQSPSSINTYFQCPRKYYFIYNLKIPTKPSIHLIRGKIAHSALENFFTLDPKAISEIQKDYKMTFQIVIVELLKKYWNEANFSCLKMSEHELNEYYKETKEMLLNWVSQFTDKVEDLVSKGDSLSEAFNKLKPITEVLYQDKECMIRGYIDAIEEIDGKVRLMDYKTSKKAHINEAYKTQLAIYAFMYEKKHGKKPEHVGIYFLKEGEKVLDVDEELIKHAKFMIEQIHASTDGVDEMKDYPKQKSPLCNWGRGQCDFYEYCFQGKELPNKP